MFFRSYILAIFIFTLLPDFHLHAAATHDDTASLHQMYRNTRGDADSLRNFVHAHVKISDKQKIIEYGRELYEIGREQRDEKSIVMGAAAMGINYVMIGERDSSLYYLSRAIEIGERIDYPLALGTAYNGMGLHAANFEANYYRAIPYFVKGLEMARRSGDTETYSILLGNIALMYYFRDSPEGLPYALECYELGVINNDPYLIYVGSYMIASIKYLTGDYETALVYLRIAEKTILSSDSERVVSPANIVLTYTLYGNILLETGDERGALSYYRKALEFESMPMEADIVGAYLGYGRYFMRKGDYASALPLFLKAADMAVPSTNMLHLHKLYKNISESYEQLGDNVNSLKYYKEYYKLAEDIFNVEKERYLSELKVQYELEKRENEIKQHRLQLLQQQRKAQVLGLIIVIILLALIGSWYMYNRKNKLYLQIVKQNQESLQTREELRKEKERSRTTATGKYAFSPLSDVKGQELFERLEGVMETGKVYQNNHLTIEKLAETLETNRSYLSRIINEYAGLNFSNYINKYRINEAVRILSDTENDIPLKALADELGFNSLSAFYKWFQKELGISPSKYREKVIVLRKIHPEKK